MGQPPVRTIELRRIKATPELLANIRHRYEHTDERLATLAVDLGCCGETVRNIAKREGWVAFVAPPRDLSPAARLRVRAEQLAEQQSPLIPAHAGIEGQDGKAVPCGPGSPLSRGRANDDLHAAIAEQMLHEVAAFLDDVRAERKRMKSAGYAKHELQAVSRVIADLSGSLNRLKPMAQRAAAPDSGNAQDDKYDDMPADLDEFRAELARRIRHFVAGRRARSGADGIAGDGAAAAQP